MLSAIEIEEMTDGIAERADEAVRNGWWPGGFILEHGLPLDQFQRVGAYEDFWFQHVGGLTYPPTLH